MVLFIIYRTNCLWPIIALEVCWLYNCCSSVKIDTRNVRLLGVRFLRRRRAGLSYHGKLEFFLSTSSFENTMRNYIAVTFPIETLQEEDTHWEVERGLRIITRCGLISNMPRVKSDEMPKMFHSTPQVFGLNYGQVRSWISSALSHQPALYIIA